MVKNDFVDDVKHLCVNEKTTLTGVAREMGISYQAARESVRRQIVNKAYVEIVGKMGYDIVVKYVKDGKEYDFT